MTTFPPGKVPHHVLARLLQTHAAHVDPRLRVGPGVGEDAAVIDFGETSLVAKTDPITFATDRVGWYAVNVNANDIAAMGATPKWFLSTVIVPEHLATESLFEEIFAQIADACSQLGVSVAGGHSEVTTGLDRPLVIGQMLGEVNSNEVIRSSGLLPGDVLLLTKGLAIEATSIVAREMPDTLRGKGWSDRDLAKAANYLTQPGISVVEDARIAQAAGEIHALHDPTEGGVATALVEIATASGVDLDIDADTLPISPLSQRLCDDVGIDPFGAISSGALLIGCTAGTTRTIVDALATRGIVAAQIGTVRSGRVEGRSSEVRLRRDNSWEALPQFSVDEIARLFTETS